MDKISKAYYKSDIGLIEITAGEKGITSLKFVDSKTVYNSQIPANLRGCVEQIDEYFRGKRKEFSIELDLQGTDFQKKVWKELLKIPYGKTVSYKDVAIAIGKRNAVRAVGAANGKNNIAIIVPCHRVIGNNRKLIGYAGGIWRKEWLLKHEKAMGVR